MVWTLIYLFNEDIDLDQVPSYNCLFLLKLDLSKMVTSHSNGFFIPVILKKSIFLVTFIRLASLLFLSNARATMTIKIPKGLEVSSFSAILWFAGFKIWGRSFFWLFWLAWEHLLVCFWILSSGDCCLRLFYFIFLFFSFLGACFLDYYLFQSTM